MDLVLSIYDGDFWWEMVTSPIHIKHSPKTMVDVGNKKYRSTYSRRFATATARTASLENHAVQKIAKNLIAMYSGPTQFKK